MRYLNSVKKSYLNSLKKSELIALITDYQSSLNKGVNLFKPVSFSSSAVIADYFRTYNYSTYRENFFVIMLKADLTLYKTKLIISGGESAIENIPITVIFKEILSELSPVTKFIVVHNHPSGDADPSAADISFTHQLIKGCGLLDLELLDHIVIAGVGDDLVHVSMRSNGVF